jgi:hypothetical protein
MAPKSLNILKKGLKILQNWAKARKEKLETRLAKESQSYNKMRDGWIIK